MYGRFKEQLATELQQIKDRGLFKKERILATPQGVEIRTESGATVLNFCANNYLGLCNEPRVMAAANNAFFRWGFGMASVRFICGTQGVHKELEHRMAEFLGMDDALLYSSAFDANGGVFEPLLDEKCAIISRLHNFIVKCRFDPVLDGVDCPTGKGDLAHELLFQQDDQRAV